MPITVPFKVMAKGYKISGDISSGYKATVPFLVDWINAYTFADEIMGKGNTFTIVGNIITVQYHSPMLFPGTVARLYAKSFDIEPIGQNGEPLTPYFGLEPGEFFTKALVVVQFETYPLQISPFDDPSGLQQLDPANPITLCEQSIKIAGKMVTRKGSGYTYADGKVLIGDIGLPQRDVKLVLKFPRLPLLPWQQVQAYVGSLNNASVLGCATGTLIFNGGDSQFTATNAGIQGQMMVLEFDWQAYDWNKQYRPDTGLLDWVYQRGGIGDASKRLFPYKTLSDLFWTYEVTE
jgi:hypothetical protein